MTIQKLFNQGATRKATVAALTLALCAAPLAACGGQSSSSEAAPAATSQAAADPSSWKTLGDALATQTSAMAAGWNDDWYVCVFGAGDSFFRVVAKMDAESSKKLDDVSASDDDYDEKLLAAIGGLELTDVEDVTSEYVAQSDLDKLVGKTGKELVDEGWSFAGYFMYGGEQTGATFEKGPFSYSFTFDVETPESKTEDGGASIMDAKLVSAEFQSAADSATDPTLVS